MKKRLRLFDKMGMNKRLTMSIFFCLILPLIVIFGIMNITINDKFKQKQYETALEVLKQSKPGIETLLKDTEMISRSIISNPNTQTLLDDSSQSEENQKRSVVNLDFFIRDLLSTRKYLSAVCISRDERIYFQCGNYYAKEDTTDLEELNRLAGLPIWKPASIQPYYLAGEGNRMTVSLMRNINHLYKMNALGRQRISIREDYICSLYETVAISENAKMFIFNANGAIISSTDKSMLGTNVSQSTVYKNATNRSGYFVDQQTEELALYYKLDGVDWILAETCADMPFDRQINIVNTLIWISLVLSLLFGLVFSAIQKFTVVNPIVRLSKDVERITTDNFEVSLHSTSSDEVGRLNRSVMEMAERMEDLINKVYISQIHTREAELLSLQSQINPHFLYNTLDTLRWLAIERGQTEIAEQVEALSGLFRHVLNKGEDFTTVRDEIEHLQDYLLIQRGRFGDKINVHMNVDEHVMDCKSLKLILQPLVENAFVHGLEKKPGGGNIYISVTETNGNIAYTVRDDGLGTDEQRINHLLQSSEPSPNVFALKNVEDRIKLKYSAAYGIVFESRPNVGTTVTAVIPMEKEGDPDETSDSGR